MVDSKNSNLKRIKVWVKKENGQTECHGPFNLPKHLLNLRLNENFSNKVNDYFFSWLTDNGSPYRVISVQILF